MMITDYSLGLKTSIVMKKIRENDKCKILKRRQYKLIDGNNWLYPGLFYERLTAYRLFFTPCSDETCC